MANHNEPATESSHLLARDQRLGSVFRDNMDAESIISSHVSRDEQLLRETAVGERLPYNDYTTIDWLHDLVRQEYLLRKETY
jgi:chloride channel 3/4/5